jgi:P63C domain-containing protein
MTKPKDVTAQSLGGLARAQKLTSDERQSIARAAAKTRWERQLPSDIKKAVAEGELKLGDITIPCAVLEGGMRVITERGLGEAFGRQRGGKDWRDRDNLEQGGQLPYFLISKRLKSFIDNDLSLVGYKRIPFRSLKPGNSGKGGVSYGTDATLVPNICRVWVNARNAGILRSSQFPIADKAARMLAGLEHVGIVALVDEATGFQETRSRDELQKILAAYVSPVLLPWTERFPIEFFKEMFRVYGWPWPCQDEEYRGPQGPRYAGKLIRKIIFENLPPGVLDELERRNPANENWQRKNRMAQLLTSDIGHPHVEKLIAVNTMLFRVSDDKEQFWRNYTRAFPKAGDQMELLPERPKDT